MSRGRVTFCGMRLKIEGLQAINPVQLVVWSMSTEISPIREDEAEDCGLPTTPDHKGTRLGWQRTGTLTPIGSPARVFGGEVDKDRMEKLFRPHTNSMSFGDPCRTQERPNSAPDRVLGCPPSPGNVFQSDVQGKLHPPSPEQPTFHPQPQRHQLVMPLLESEASPGLEGREQDGNQVGSQVQMVNVVNNANIFGEALKPRPKPLTGWDENSSAPTPAPVPTPLGTSCSTPALDTSTPSPEQNGFGADHKDSLESPKPRSVQNTPEPSHHYSCGAAISTPSPCAMSSFNQLGWRLNEAMPGMLGNFELPVLPPPLPSGSGPMGMGCGVPEVPNGNIDMSLWGMRPQEMTAQQQLAALSFQAYNWGQMGHLPAWRFPGPVPPVPPVPETRPKERENSSFPKEGLTKELYPKTSSAATGATGAAAATRNGHQGNHGNHGNHARVSSGDSEAKERKLDVSSLPSEAQELVGQVNQMSKTQAGSKFLQRQLLKGSGAAVEVILAEVEDEIAAMMCDSYGNYLCSAAFRACSQRQRQRMLEKLAPQIGQIACDKRGTHALQALIGFLQLEEEQLQLMTAIKSQVIHLSKDPNGILEN